MLECLDTVEKLGHFLWTQDRRQALGSFRRRDDRVHRPPVLERDGVEKAERRRGDDEGRRRQFLLVDQDTW